MGTPYQTYGKLYYYEGKLTDVAPPDVARAARKADEDAKKAQKAADEKRLKQMKERQAELEKEGLRDAVKETEWKSLNAQIKASEAALKDLEVTGALNQTLSSARRWLAADEVSWIAIETYLGGVVARFAGGAAAAAEAHRAEQAVEVLHGASEVNHAGHAAHAVFGGGFPAITDEMSAEQIHEYGAEVQKMSGLEGAQVSAEGRKKFQEQFDASAKAREEKAEADKEAREAQQEHAAALRAAAAKGVFVSK